MDKNEEERLRKGPAAFQLEMNRNNRSFNDNKNQHIEYWILDTVGLMCAIPHIGCGRDLHIYQVVQFNGSRLLCMHSNEKWK